MYTAAAGERSSPERAVVQRSSRERAMIDATDRAILTILQDNARTSNAEIARQVGLAPSAIF